MTSQRFDLNFPVLHDDIPCIIDLNTTHNADEEYVGDELDQIHEKCNAEEEQVNNILEQIFGEEYEEIGEDEQIDEGEEFVEDEPFTEAGDNGGQQMKTSRNILTEAQRDTIFYSLLRISVNGKLKKTATSEVANKFNLHIRQVQRIWKTRKGLPHGEVRHKLKCGRKKIHVDIERIREIPLKQRTTLESLSNALGVSLTTLFRRFKEGLFRRHSNAIKPYLREENKRSRLQFCVSMIDKSLPNQPKFVDMYNVVHIDEKWFYMTRKDENYLEFSRNGHRKFFKNAAE